MGLQNVLARLSPDNPQRFEGCDPLMMREEQKAVVLDQLVHMPLVYLPGTTLAIARVQ